MPKIAKNRLIIDRVIQKVKKWTFTWNSVVSGKRKHGPTIRALKLTLEEASPGAESAVYDCLVLCIAIA